MSLVSVGTLEVNAANVALLEPDGGDKTYIYGADGIGKQRVSLAIADVEAALGGGFRSVMHLKINPDNVSWLKPDPQSNDRTQIFFASGESYKGVSLPIADVKDALA